MDQTTTRIFEEAVALIKAQKQSEAASALARILASDPENERAWHMLSYALTEPHRQLYALKRVLQINPGNVPARKRLAELSEASALSTASAEPSVQPEPEAVPLLRLTGAEGEQLPADVPPAADEPEAAPTTSTPVVSEPDELPTIIAPAIAAPEGSPPEIRPDTGPPELQPTGAVAAAEPEAPSRFAWPPATGSRTPSRFAWPPVAEPEPDRAGEQVLDPTVTRPTPVPDRRLDAGDRNATAMTATMAVPRAFPFPGTGEMPRIKYGRGHRLRIRAHLLRRRAKMDWAVFSQSRFAILGLALIIMFALMAVAHPILIKTVWPSGVYDPITGFDMAVFPHPSQPGAGHLLGTDTLGRDVLSMLLAATTPTFTIGLTAALATAVVGTLMSVIAAYFRGAADAIITNLADVFLLLPAPVIMVIIGARFRELGPVHLGLIYGVVTGAGPTAIVMRSHAIQTMARPYMEAAEISGGGAAHIIFKHLMPAMLPLAALQMMIAVTGAVVADGFISFFGLTRASSNWGTLIYDAFVYNQISTASGVMWHMLLPAALCFSLFAMGFYLVSRGLHRVASPTIRDEQGAA